MTSFDYIVLAIFGISIIVGVMRGLVKEIFALTGWVVAFYVAKTYVARALPLMPAEIPNEALRTLAAFLVLFLGTLLLSTLLAIALSSLIKKLELGWLNTTLGATFGFLRGLIIVCVLVMLAGLTSLPQDARWRNAMFSAPLEALVADLTPLLPQSIRKHLSYE